ncbi:right-handed parallel beta-helix repeat-containing protein [Thermodesulforhabdus norvegica]|uniref:Parallel beta-helix repeat (Two copies) n=1 Tax=Thermodesulforhabdus norvegica TaxID=39841 RepID=A0A1I4UYW3_9BACT|nr:right-handed parallel beta-helix repeat-containing protein [Thermodesulforhabdus norvegica]SFM94162.1 parallel beta-helix repeat (two copies) [Thermodesulforhabdus norvegica]
MKRLMTLIILGCLYPLVAFGATWTVHPSGTSVNGAYDIAGFSAIDWSKIRPGDVVTIRGSEGIYREPLTIAGRGTASAPITVRAADGEEPIIENAVVFSGASYVVFEGITVRKSPYSGVIIRDGSHHITVTNCTIHDNLLGIWIGEGAGEAHLISTNNVYNNKTHGIAVDLVNCSPGNETVITSNEVHGNGHHGIEIRGNYYIIEKNIVYENGFSTPGTSGIHIYSGSAGENSGDYNIIRYNISYRNKETSGPDGNGIQLDQWCDFNEVYYNICYENDGAGISVFDSSGSRVFNNTLVGNMLDPGKSHPFKAELYLAGDSSVNHTRNVAVLNNILVATRSSVAPIAVYDPATRNDLTIGHNLLHSTSGDLLYLWGGTSGRDLAVWNSLAAGGGDDFAGDPAFAGIATGGVPSEPADLTPSAGSPAVDAGISMGQTRDILGNSVPSGKGVDIGAVESTALAESPLPLEPPKNLRLVR